MGNNPLIYSDPTGHSWTVDLALPLTAEDKQAIDSASTLYANATTDAVRALAHQRAMDVRNKYISDKNLKDAIRILQRDGTINSNLDFTSGICSGLSSIELIYALAGTLISSNYDNYISVFSFGNSTDEGLEQFYGEIVCFTGDTLISTKDGDKEIKDIKVGDEVYSENVATGEKGLKRVKEVFLNETSEITHIKIGDEEINATPTHPFWVNDKGWVKAGDLKKGDKVVLFSGEQVIISSVDLEKLQQPVKTYNFEVEDWHTYFVSSEHVLVHNKCGSNPLGQTGSYVITFQSGMQYVGKGSYMRSKTSANRVSLANNDPVVDVEWEWAASGRAAFKAEYLKMIARGLGTVSSSIYNLIQSPGQKYYEEDGDEY